MLEPIRLPFAILTTKPLYNMVKNRFGDRLKMGPEHADTGEDDEKSPEAPKLPDRTEQVDDGGSWSSYARHSFRDLEKSKMTKPK